jgi:hypothetical protein
VLRPAMVTWNVQAWGSQVPPVESIDPPEIATSSGSPSGSLANPASCTGVDV